MMYKKFMFTVGTLLIATSFQAQAENHRVLNNNKKAKLTSKSIMKVTNEFEWKQGQSPTRLGIKGNQGVCFLTRVVGKFDGFVEQVHVYIDGADGEWKLGGSSAKYDVGGNARCIVTSVSYQ